MPPGKTKAQMDAEAIAPGRQPTAPYNGWKTLSPSAQQILSTNRGYTQATFDAPGAAKARELAAKFSLSGNAFKNSRLLDQGIPIVGAGAPPVPPAPQAPMTANKATAANIGSFVSTMAGATMGGMAGLPMNALNSAASATQAAPAPAPAPAPTANKQGSAMTDKQMFKVAFLAKCIDEGLTMDGIKLRVKQALYFAKKEAIEKRALDWSTLGLAPFAAAALGIGGSYWAGNQILGPGLHQVTKPRLPSKEDLLSEELINEYDKQTENVTREAELTRRRRARDRNISGITRY